MHWFVDLDRVLGAVPAPLVMALRDIDRGQGREGLYLNQVPGLLTDLANRARVASITASSALEGVVVNSRSLRLPSSPIGPSSCAPAANKSSPATAPPSTTSSPRTGAP